MKQFLITTAAGKCLIAKAVAKHHALVSALKSGTVVIVAGTTNGYVAEEVLSSIGQLGDFNRQRFFRGVTLPPFFKKTKTGRSPDEGSFPGDVVIKKGKWHKTKTIFDVIDDLKKGDVILKGANAVDLQKKQAGVLIGHPKGGTIVAALQAIVGRRVRLIVPVGLEKRVSMNLNDIAGILNAPDADGARFIPVPGEIVTELEALTFLTGVNASLVAAGGVCGAEGAVWIAISGTAKQESAAKKLISSIAGQPPFVI